MKKLIIVIIVAMAAIGATCLLVISRDNPRRAYVKARLKAMEGNVVAQGKLGEMYLDGRGIQQDYAEALRWCGKAASNGNVKATALLGRMYAEGLGVKPDLSEALKWFRQAAEQGDAYAQYAVGQMHVDGICVARNFAEAAAWFKKAAAQGEPAAQNNLAWMYFQGLGVEKNVREAFQLCSKSAAQGNNKAQALLGELYQQGLGVKQDYTQALKWYSKAAEQGSLRALYGLGCLYAEGLGVKQDYIEAYAYFSVAGVEQRAGADRHRLERKMSLQDITQAIRRSTELDPQAKQLKAQSKPEVAEWSQSTPAGDKAFRETMARAEKGDAEAQSLVGAHYEMGINGVAVDYPKAMSWYRKAAAQGDVDALKQLGFMHYQGHGVKINFVEAYACFDLAAAKDPEAVQLRNHLKNLMNRQQLEAAQRRALELRDSLRKAASR